MTLTTERQQFEEWFTNKYPRSYWGVEKTASGEYQGGLAAPLWEAWQESRGCMANREAQPVAWRHDNGQLAGIEITSAKSVAESWIAEGGTVTPLYTAPPAPAVNAAPDFEAWFNSPEAGLRVVNFHIQHELQLKAWNACRAAMLAQPVSSGYKLPDGFKLMPLEMTDEIGEAIAMEAHCCGGIALCIYEAALAAAPEGGNDHDTRR
ncbi:hypothetical protein [Serratia marcescens]|uniref:hypothetical protein n=1 Tax=Serratia marcescens TaxID=615 RepID=UPI00315B21BD